MDKSSILLRKYNELTNILNINDVSKNNIYSSIRNIINDFFSSHSKVGIYCFGIHTKMLMTDFISELRDIVCIIDNGEVEAGGFLVIKDDEIEKYELDGIIISSYRYRNEVKESIKNKHKNIDFLDIYDGLKENGIELNEEFYGKSPYGIYKEINELKRKIDEDKSDNSKKERIYLKHKLLTIYIQIKDFRMAQDLCEKLVSESGQKYIFILNLIKEIYSFQKEIISSSNENNILVLCLDGMRYSDFESGKLNKIERYLSEESYIFSNAYSYSTMTFESLIPVFSENSNQKTKYYQKDYVDSKECRFINKAFDQNRFVTIYGDGNRYIDDKRIKYSESAQCITEKIWDFVLDICNLDNGIFYLHELYESHYSFPNPYTTSELIALGTALVFDFIPRNGGKLQTDYNEQLNDSLRYLDDTLFPFISAFPGSIVVFADHGNMILDKETKLKDVPKISLIASEEWIRIPLSVKTPSGMKEKNTQLISLMELNEIMLSILDNKPFIYKEPEYIKIGRSPIYNPDFKEIYQMNGNNYDGEAFEGFIFRDGYKLIVYSNGKRELFLVENDRIVEDNNLIAQKYNQIKDMITVL